MPDSIFPIEIPACETANYTQSAHRYRATFMHEFRSQILAASPRATWFAYDVILHSRTDVEFVVYDMRNNLTGGIGDETHRIRSTVPDSLTTEDVERAIYGAAMRRRAAELAAEEDRICAGYADEIRASIDA